MNMNLLRQYLKTGLRVFLKYKIGSVLNRVGNP